MARITKMNSRKPNTLLRVFSESSMVEISLRMEGMAFSVRSGLNSLKVLIELILVEDPASD